MNPSQMKSSTTRPDHGGLYVSFPLLAVLPASGLDEISKKKSPTTGHPKDLSTLLESSQTTAPSQESFINSSSAAAVSEALALLGSMANGSF